ncbi:helix-turn-helix domain-containing protein [Glutamicibacter sp. V16R2B1]|uniref:helix-turn-helix domain-containing protein n=1 Tax=Glutamicibacter sp. V16R2B1 TaxID=2036207 RepID=UPI0010FD66D3|nr:helix-turn-helix domain-containing protein [Glutamicibacter sp. V16R2B1]MCK9901216.1 helix-turn-helix domain-containing protein [Frankia sp. Cpl3]TLK48009.1 helix-turn-helix domain-containing protein [Glutamicibacter sp. V16R2B1]
MEPLLTPDQLAEVLHVEPKTLANWRGMNPPRGPRFVKIGSLVRYRTLDVLAYVQAMTVETVLDTA